MTRRLWLMRLWGPDLCRRPRNAGPVVQPKPKGLRTRGTAGVRPRLTRKAKRGGRPGSASHSQLTSQCPPTLGGWISQTLHAPSQTPRKQYSPCSLGISSSVSPHIHFHSLLPLGRLARGILVPQPGIEPVLPALAAPSLNHWTIREDPHT